ncbi:MAG: hypothetical protein ACRCW9_06545 [Cetobacterium sp.]
MITFRNLNHLKYFCYRNKIIFNKINNLLKVSEELIKLDKIKFPLRFIDIDFEDKLYNFDHHDYLFNYKGKILVFKNNESHKILRLFEQEENDYFKLISEMRIDCNPEEYFNYKYDYLNNNIKFFIKEHLRTNDEKIQSFEIGNEKLKINNAIVNYETFGFFFFKILKNIGNFYFTTKKIDSFDLIENNVFGIPKFYNKTNDEVYINNKLINNKINNHVKIYSNKISLYYYSNKEKNILYYDNFLKSKIIPICINKDQYEQIVKIIKKDGFKNGVIITTDNSYLIEANNYKEEFYYLDLKTLENKSFKIENEDGFEKEFLKFTNTVRDDFEFQEFLKINYLKSKLLKK